MTDIHTRIHDLRTAKNLSMEALAKLLDVNWQTVQQWEKPSGTSPTRKRLPAVAAALGTSVEYLITGRHPSTETLVREDSPRPYVHPNEIIQQIITMCEATDEAGRGIALMAVGQALERYRPPPAKAA